MGGRCVKKIIVSFCVLGAVVSADARCLLADKYRKEGKLELEAVSLNLCAIQYNDDESQMILAERYMAGKDGAARDEESALYMYQLSAENGNAEAQVKLAELLQTFDTNSERRSVLKKYQTKLEKIDNTAGSFSGEILHPYTLLLLASERPENKWYYPSLTRAAPARASVLLKKYKITSEKRKAALQDASKWKTRKLLEMAKEILSSEEYPDFERRLKDSGLRTQAMSELKERLVGYVDTKKKERLSPL